MLRKLADVIAPEYKPEIHFRSKGPLPADWKGVDVVVGPKGGWTSQVAEGLPVKAAWFLELDRDADEWVMSKSKGRAGVLGITNERFTEDRSMVAVFAGWADDIALLDMWWRDNDSEDGLLIAEVQAIEVVAAAVRDAVDDSSNGLERAMRAALQAHADTIQAQARSPHPDRKIIGRALRHINSFAGGLVVGVAGNYLTDLIKSFPVPWP